jgi:hypothetical protein
MSQVKASYQNAAVRSLDTPVTVPGVPLATQRLSATVERLGAAVEALAKRLEPVLRPDMPQKTGPDILKENSCELARNISDSADSIAGRCYWLESLLERLEV